MTTPNLIVILGSIAFLAAFYWWFFVSKREQSAAAASAGSAGFQQVEIVVKGGYVPDVVEVERGTPLRLLFRREESGACTDRVVIPDFHISQSLPAFSTTPVEFTPDQPGEHGFECGMGMIHGKLVVREPRRSR